MPSRASSDSNNSCCSSRSSARLSPKLISRPDCTARLIRPTALLALRGGVNCVAYSWIASLKFGTSHTSFTRPIVFASSNESSCPATIISMARALPTSRANRCVPPVPGSTPRATSGRPILPPSLRAIRMSAASATSRPPPTVWPVQRGNDELRRLREAVERLVRVKAEVVLELRIGLFEHADVGARAEEFVARAAQHDHVHRAIHPRVEHGRVDLAHHLVGVGVRGRIVQLDCRDTLRGSVANLAVTHTLQMQPRSHESTKKNYSFSRLRVFVVASS